MTTTVAPEPIDLATVPGAGGVLWSVTAGFHANLVGLDPGEAIANHRNDALDVLIVGVAGSGTLVVDGARIPLLPATAVVVPKGATRGVGAGPHGVRYLTVHAERGPLVIGTKPEDPDV